MAIIFPPRTTNGQPAAVDPAFTMARAHLAETCERSDLVLPVYDIWKDIKDAAERSGSRIAPRTLIEEFFGYRREFYPDQQPYVPVKVIEVDPTDTRGGGARALHEWPELTELLRKLDDKPQGEHDRSGVVLLARSGAGKTLASYKALFDCFTSSHDGTPPPLAGRLPIWLNTWWTEHSSDDKLTVARLVETTLDVDLPTDWVRHTPPLLILVDLNAASANVRRELAGQLHAFQRDFGRTPYRHRCVVTYRSTQHDDAVMSQLVHDDVFRCYDMRPLRAESAAAYVRTIRGFESAVLQAHHVEPRRPIAEVDEQVEHLLTLVREFTNGPESIISTPLLMHFCSVLLPKDYESIHTVTDLYERVVDRLIQRNWNHAASHLQVLGSGREAVRSRVLTAMVRVALWMIEHGEVRIPRGVLRYLLLDPETDYKSWWPKDSWWHDGDYHRDGFTDDEINKLTEFSLLRVEGEAFAFLHDSFAYYLAAYGLRYAQGVGRPQSLDQPSAKAWPEKVAARLRLNALHWQLPARFLGGRLAVEEIKGLAKALLEADPAAGVPALLRDLLRGKQRQVTEDSVLAPIFRFLIREQQRLAEDPDRLYQELHNEVAHVRGSDPCSRWLATLQQPSKPDIMFLRVGPRHGPSLERLTLVHDTPVRSARFSEDGQRIISACEDGTATIWDAVTGTALLVASARAATADSLHDLAQGGRSASINPDGTRLLSVYRRGPARLWDTTSGDKIADIPTIVFGSHEVGAAEFRAPDGLLLSVLTSGMAHLWDPVSGSERAELDLGQGQTFNDVWLESRGKRIVAATDSSLMIWDTNTGRSLATLPLPSGFPERDNITLSSDGRWLLTFGSFERIVRIWDLAQPSEPPRSLDPQLDTRRDFIRKTLFSPTGDRCAALCNDGTVCVWHLREGTATVTSLTGGTVLSGAFSADGTRIALVTPDMIHVWDVNSATPRCEQPTHDVLSVAYAPQGSALLTCHSDHTVRVWYEPELDAPTTTPRYVYDATCVRGGGLLAYKYSTSIDVIDIESGVPQRVLITASQSTPHLLSISPSGQLIATSCANGTCIVSHVQSQWTWRLCGLRGPVNRALFSPDSKRLVTISEDLDGGEDWRLWDATSQRELAHYIPPRDLLTQAEVANVVFSRDSQRLLVCVDDGERWVVLSDAVSGEELNVIHLGVCDDLDLAFSHDGSRFVLLRFEHVPQNNSGPRDMTVKWYASHSGTPLSIVEISCGVECSELERVIAEFDPSSLVIAEWGTAEGVVRLWDAVTGAMKVELPPQFSIKRVHLVCKGSRVVTHARGEHAALWDGTNGTFIQTMWLPCDRIVSTAWGGHQWLLTTCPVHRTRVWDAHTGSELARLWAGRSNCHVRVCDHRSVLLFVGGGVVDAYRMITPSIGDRHIT